MLLNIIFREYKNGNAVNLHLYILNLYNILTSNNLNQRAVEKNNKICVSVWSLKLNQRVKTSLRMCFRQT